MENENPEIRPPQRFINRSGKRGVTNKSPRLKLKPNWPTQKELITNTPCPPGLGSKPYGGRPDQLTLYKGPKWRQWLIRKSRLRRNDPCPCGSGLKYKKCCIDQLTLKNLKQ